MIQDSTIVAISRECCAFSGMSRPTMTPDFSVMSSFSYVCRRDSLLNML